jgi:drug/metabolite transporter (DMT)-like permease
MVRRAEALSDGLAARPHLSLVGVVIVWAGVLGHQAPARRRRCGDRRRDPALRGRPARLRARPLAGPGLPGLTRGDAVRVVAAGLLVVLGYHLFLNVGTRHTTSGVAALVVALAPALTLVLALVLGLDRIRPRHVVGLALAGLRGLGPTRAVSYTYAISPLAVLIGAVALDEELTPWIVLGAALVVGGIALAQRGLPWRWDSVRPWRSAPSRSGS